jgi:hypothetical protein
MSPAGRFALASTGYDERKKQLRWHWVRHAIRGNGMGFLAELWSFMRVRKKFWLVPILGVMMVFGGLLWVTQGSAVAPFIYTLF